MGQTGSFFSELRRRNVFRVGVAYAIVAWLLVEVASVVLPTLLLPDWTLRILVFFVILGFPLALFFAWAYELTPEGLKKEKDVDRSQSITRQTGRKLDFAIIGVLAIAVVLFAVDKFVWVGEGPATGVAVSDDRKSIAVLPFADRSAAEENAAFFAAGIHDDLLTLLSKLGDLKVIARTTVERLDPSMSIGEIGTELDVATVLEGGVQRAGDRVRINVQLIDTTSEAHLWAETYDRELTAANIFAVQTEIATAIAQALQATLSPVEQERLKTVPTENLAALEAYFLGKQRMAKRTSGALAEAVEYFQQAIELDPDFALAYVGLADSYHLQEEYSGLPPEEMFAKAEAAITKALELDDRMGEGYATLGIIKSETDDYEGAEAAYKKALELTPNYATTYQWYGNLLRRLGRSEEALAQHEKGVELDPLSAIINVNVAGSLSALGRFDEALAQFKKVVEIDPAFPSAYWGIGSIYRTVSGQLDQAAAWYRKAIALDPGNAFRPAVLGWLYLNLGDEQQAERWISRSMELGPESFWPNFTMQFLHVYRGEEAKALDYARKVLTINPRTWYALAYLSNHDLQAGRYAEARARYEKTFPKLLNDDEPTIDRTNLIPAIDLAYVLSKTGEQERANLLLDRSLTFIQTIPRLGWEGYGIRDVLIYAQQGKTREALSALRQAIDERWRGAWWYFAEHDPSLESIRDEPEFQAMVEEIKADMAAQLERVRAMEASGELEPVPDIN